MMQRCVRVLRQSLAYTPGYGVFWVMAGCAGLTLNSPGYTQEAGEPAAAAREKPGNAADDRAPRTSLDLSRVFEQLDRDSSGTITLDEVPESLRDRVRPLFERLGTDTITREDLARLNTSRREVSRSVPLVRGPAIFRVLDENGDGRISRQELSRAAERFDELDEDGDDAITPDELFAQPGGDVGPRDAAVPLNAAPRTPQPRPRTSPEGQAAAADNAPANSATGTAAEPAQGSARSVNRDLGARLFQRYDQNGDGRLAREEAPAALRQNFERFDADGDGHVTQEEFAAVVAAVRESNEDEGQLRGESAASPSPVAGAEPRRAAD